MTLDVEITDNRLPQPAVEMVEMLGFLGDQGSRIAKAAGKPGEPVAPVADGAAKAAPDTPVLIFDIGTAISAAAVGVGARRSEA